ncbi:MAG: MarR family transcriptional regulator [Nitrospira sp.]|nr:MarR family transcriptional regulator [Nitrospira sp.]
MLSGSSILSYTSPVKSLKSTNGKLSTLEIVLRLQGLFRHRLHPLGLSPLQASTLLYLDRRPQCEVPEIASALCISNLAAVETVQLIQKNGWIHKPRVNSDRKVLKLQLTEKGTVLAQKVKANIAVTDKLFALAHRRNAA